MNVCHYYSPLNYLAHAARAIPPTPSPTIPRRARMHSWPGRGLACAPFSAIYLPISLSGSIARHCCCSPSGSTSITRCCLGRGTYVCIACLSREDGAICRGAHRKEGCSDLINPCKASRLTIPVPTNIQAWSENFNRFSYRHWEFIWLQYRSRSRVVISIYRSDQMTSLLRYICKQVRSCRIQAFLVINENGFERKNRGLAQGSKRAIFFTQCCRDDAERASEKFWQPEIANVANYWTVTRTYKQRKR